MVDYKGKYTNQSETHQLKLKINSLSAYFNFLHIKVDVNSGNASMPRTKVTLHCQQEVEWLKECSLSYDRRTRLNFRIEKDPV